MAMNETAMAALIKANIEALSNWPNNGQTPVIVDIRILEAVCKGIIDHIKAAQTVTSTGLVTSGPGAGGAVTATSTTIT